MAGNDGNLTAPKWAPGESGNPGGKHAVRRKLEKAFLEDLHAKWQAHGPAIIDKLIQTRPQEVLKAVAGLLPKQINIEDPSAPDRERAARLLELVSRRLDELTERVAPPDNGSGQGVPLN